MKSKYIFVGVLMLLFALALAACQTAGPSVATEPSNTQAQPTQAPCPTPETCPECETCPPAPVVENVPFQDEWANSAHNAVDDEAFNHWNEEEAIPESCAKCHSTPGYLDWMGADGTEFRVVNAPAAKGTTIQCVACHNAQTEATNSVLFPSGVEITVADASSRCARCHQGRESKVSVDAKIEELGLTEDVDTVNEKLSFSNIHYFAAAATLYGSVVHGGYEYDGQEYEAKFDHVAGFNTCIGCHDQHSLELKIESCANCHEGVASVEDLRNIRMAGSLKDYDGDGNIEEGISFEVAGLQEQVLAAIQAYGKEVSGTPITYDAARYPYFFADANENAAVDEGEEGYKAWTARLLKAGYNYQVSIKDPGAYAHKGKYIIELLNDSLASLNEKLATPIDMSAMVRMDAGHFASGEEAWRHWDEEESGLVPATCVKCHTATGLPVFLANGGVVIAQPPSSGLNCATCHDDLSTFTRRTAEQVIFPSGATLSFDSPDANLCILCHQGRESKVSIDAAIAKVGVGNDDVSEALAFRNPHYFAAGATLFGTQAKGAYEFEGKEYNGKLTHVQPFDTCVECHNAHSLEIKVENCSQCHGDVALEEIRMEKDPANPVDYDGDGNATEGIAQEIATMQETLYAAIQAYSANHGGALIFNGGRYPYWFGDADGSGDVNGDEAAYKAWTPALLRAAYNYTWVAKDPGAFAHNSDYVMQFLYDSIQSLGGDVSGMTRPPVAAPAQ